MHRTEEKHRLCGEILIQLRIDPIVTKRDGQLLISLSKFSTVKMLEKPKRLTHSNGHGTESASLRLFA